MVRVVKLLELQKKNDQLFILDKFKVHLFFILNV